MTGSLVHALLRCAITALCAAILLASLPLRSAAVAQTPAAAQGAGTTPEANSDKVRQLLKLLADPEIQGWVAQRDPAVRDGQAAGQAPTGAAREAQAPRRSVSLAKQLANQLARIRQRLITLWTVLPTIPAQFAHAKQMFGAEFDGNGRFHLLLLFGVFVALGFGAESLFRTATRSLRRRWADLSLETVGGRIRIVLFRFLLSIGLVGSFALGSVGAFLLIDWPPLLREVVLDLLMAFLAFRLSVAAGRFLLAPPTRSNLGDGRFRVVPINTRAATFWDRRLLVAVGWLACGTTAIWLLGAFGFSEPSQMVLTSGVRFGLLLIAIEAVWRAPDALRLRAGVPSDGALGNLPVARAITAYLILLFVLGVTMPRVFALALVAGLLPLAMRLAAASVNHILRPPGAEWHEAETETLRAVLLTRGVRTLLIVAAGLYLGYAWEIDLVSLTTQDTLANRILRDLINATVILLAADLIWHAARVIIDEKLRAVGPPGTADTAEDKHHARVRTLLPILRNLLLVIIVIVGVMMALSGMGVAIGPLIASAGVFGVAIGFGSQTLIRDIISGVFYLVDDAFRIGEYIQSGTYKGVVESFSLRSVKLRHHRGPLYTVPFGSLGAVQNMSRDWTIDKMTVGVTYSTDLNKVKAIIKDIGKKLLQDPELAPHIIETLKMQGVEAFGDYAIQLRFKMTTKPGEQFIVRRRALAMMKTAFDANGIGFAFPTVMVGGGGQDEAAAAARQSLDLARQKALAEAET